MSRRIDQNKTPDPLPGEVIESFLKLGIPYRLAILDFAEAAIPAQTTQDSAFVEAGIVAGRLLLQFLGLGVTRKGGLTLIPSREYHIDNGFTDEVKVIDIGGRLWISLPLRRRPLTRSRTFIMVLRRHLHILLGFRASTRFRQSQTVYLDYPHPCAHSPSLTFERRLTMPRTHSGVPQRAGAAFCVDLENSIPV